MAGVQQAEVRDSSSSSSLTHLYSLPQQYALHALSVPGGILSLMGSLLICIAVLRGSNKPQATTTTTTTTTFERLLLGLSCMDICTSLSNIFVYWPWSIPSEANYFVHNASGTWSTCNFNGFMTNLSTSTLLYSAFLALFHVLLVRSKPTTCATTRMTTEEYVAQRVEPWMHAIGLLYPIGTGIFAIATKAYNPLVVAPGRCWFTDWPPECEDDPTVDCDGARASDGIRKILRWSVGIFPAVLCFVVIVVSMILLYLEVRTTEQRLQQYTSSRAVTTTTQANSFSGSRGDSTTTGSSSLTQETAMKGILYVSAFLVAWLPYFIFLGVSFTGDDDDDDNSPEEDDIVDVVNKKNPTLLFPFAAMYCFLSPFQGLWNALVYFRERRSLFEDPEGPLHWFWPIVQHITCCCFAPDHTILRGRQRRGGGGSRSGTTGTSMSRVTRSSNNHQSSSSLRRAQSTNSSHNNYSRLPFSTSLLSNSSSPRTVECEATALHLSAKDNNNNNNNNNDEIVRRTNAGGGAEHSTIQDPSSTSPITTTTTTTNTSRSRSHQPVPIMPRIVSAVEPDATVSATTTTTTTAAAAAAAAAASSDSATTTTTNKTIQQLTASSACGSASSSSVPQSTSSDQLVVRRQGGEVQDAQEIENWREEEEHQHS